jgi:hypothetical protein
VSPSAPESTLLARLRPHLSELEELRLRAKRGRRLAWVVQFFAILPFVLGARGPIFLFIAGLGALVSLTLGYRITKAWQAYRTQYKARVIKALVAEFESGWAYTASSTLTQSEYGESSLSPMAFDRFLSEDQIRGRIEGVSFSWSEVHTQRWVREGKRRRLEPVFTGFVLSADFPRATETQTLVLPDYAESRFGSYVGKLLQGWNVQRASLVNFENPEFEKLYVVYSNDPVEAHAILTPRLMEELVALRKNFREGVTLSFRHSKLWLALPTGRNVFEPRLDRLAGESDIETLLSLLAFQRKVIETLCLRGRRAA